MLHPPKSDNVQADIARNIIAKSFEGYDLEEVNDPRPPKIHQDRQSHHVGLSRRGFLAAASASAVVVVGTSQVGVQQALAATEAAESTLLSAAAEAGASSVSELVSGLLAGAISRTCKELLLHPLDTIKSRLQYTKDSRKITPELFEDLYSGILPPIIAGAPAGAVFFGIKDYVKSVAGQTLGENQRQLSTILAVLAAQFPYWAIRSPSELIKTRRQTGLATNGTVDALKTIYEEEGVKGLYTGYQSNILYAFPTDVIKFLVYDTAKQQYKIRTGKKLNPVEAAITGALSSATAQIFSTPLDVARTRILTRKKVKEGSSMKEEENDKNLPQVLIQIAKEEGVGALFAGVSTRILRSLGSGAIQFSSYEITKSLFGEEFAKSLKK